MRWISVILFTLLASVCTAKEEDNSNEVSVSPPSININVNLRKALLKALIELENEDNNVNLSNQDDSDRTIEKASASALSVYTSSEENYILANSEKPSTEKIESSSEPLILFQKSHAVQQAPITTLEKEELDPFNDAEQILTSASSSFTLSNSNSIRPDIESRSINKGVLNSIKDDKPSTTEKNKIEITTFTPTSSTEESEAKAEEVQFFSAPLVAAFTVHQDEQGVPKKVESILRPPLKKQEDENQLKTKPKDSKPENAAKFQQVDPQLEFQQKQKLLEQEILRLNLNLKQQQLLNQQQQEIFVRQQQEQLRLRNNAQPFLPIINPTFKQFNSDPNTEKPIANQLKQIAQPLPTKPAQQFNSNINNNSGVTLISSITYDPVLEAGKLPLNAQILPIKGPVNFHTPIIQSAGFQQFHSLPHVTPLVTTFSPIPISQPQFIVTPQQGKRIFRQEIGTGNFVNSDINRESSFSLQKSVQPSASQLVDSNFRQNYNGFAFVQPQPVNNFYQSNIQGTVLAPQQPQNYRFFRSHPETNYKYTTSFGGPQSNNNQLSNLLYNSGAFRSKEPEDINIISKVLALNHSGTNPYVNVNTFGKK